MSEEEAIRAAEAALLRRGYRLVIQPERARETVGYRPDLVGVKDGQTIFVEVRSVTGGMSEVQLERMREAAAAGGAEFALFQYDPEGGLVVAEGLERPWQRTSLSTKRSR